MKRTAKTIIGLVGVVAAAAVWSACSASDESPKTGSTAGAPGAGGAPPAAGGAPGAGGDTSSVGGAPPAAGGAPGAGGDTSSVGGAPPAAGGAPGAGGDTSSVGGAPPAAGGAPGAGGDTSSVGGAPGVGGATATTCTPTGTLPFTVTDKFAPGATNGVWGNWGSVKIAACTARGTGTPAGKCNTLTYAYDAAVGSDCTGVAIVAPAVSCAWTAVAWHVADPGVCIPPGATKVTFQAWGTGVVGFGAGGAEIAAQTLTATATPYTIDLTTSATPYTGVATATGFTITFTSTNGAATVNVDDIKWIQ